MTSRSCCGSKAFCERVFSICNGKIESACSRNGLKNCTQVLEQKIAELTGATWV